LDTVNEHYRRALANNFTNLRLGTVLARFSELYKLDPLELIEQEPDPGLGSGGLGRLAAVSSVPWRHTRDKATFGKISIC
jgi:glucan phosphorylase